MNTNQELRNALKDKKRIVVKIGSSSITHPETGALNLIKLEILVRELCDLKNMGKDVVLVSSGAIAVGRQAAGFRHRPQEVSEKQACAAIGQAQLLMIYQKLFSEYGHQAAQILMTKETMLDHLSRRNATNTFDELFKMGAIPVVNENDTVSTYEIRFGDNDTLSALVAALIHADLLILLSDIDGLYSDEDMLHFFFYSVDGIRGVNPIEYNAGAIAAGVGAQEFGNEYFEKRGNIRAVIETDKLMNKELTRKFLDNFEESKRYGNPLLTHGFKWKNITAQPDTSQMIESKTLSIQDVARIFMVPPHLLGDLSRSTFSNIEHQDIEFVKHYIRPTVKMYEQELDRKLFFDEERGHLETKFNLDGLLRGDLTTRADFYQKAVLSGWMSRNEAREMEHMNPLDGLDEMLYPGNENITGKPNETTKK